MKPLIIIESPSNLGLKESAQGKEPGVSKLPQHLKKHGLYDKLNPAQIIHLAAPPYSSQLDEASGVLNAYKIAEYAKVQAQELKRVLSTDSFPVVIGGDCSILIGNALALKELGNYGLMYLDGHTDFVLPSMSQTGGAAGMDLAIVTGHGHPKLTNIHQLEPYFEEENVWCIGNRYWDPEYVGLIQSSQIEYVPLSHLREMGIDTLLSLFFMHIEAKKWDGFWIHLDVDVLDHKVMPAVDSPQPGGMSYEELRELLIPLMAHPKVAGIQLTILDPTLDPYGIYAQRLIDNLVKILSPIFREVKDHDEIMRF